MRCDCGHEFSESGWNRAKALGATVTCGGCGQKHVTDELASWFADYHAKHPQVYEAFKEMAREVMDMGLVRYGAKTIMERLRWEHPVRMPGSNFKLSNTIKDRCSARYARRLIRENPSFDGFFELRDLTTEEEREKLSVAHKRGKGEDA